MKVRELMTRDVEALAPGATLEEAAQKMAASNVGSLPVLVGRKPVGVITDRDIVVRALAEGMKPSETKVSSVMSADVVRCSEDDEVETAASLMAEARLRRLPVVDSAGELTGVVALGDIPFDAAEPRASFPAGESLSSLIKDELAAAETYRQALQTVRGPGAEELRRIESDHEEAALVLSERMKGLGGTPPVGTGLWGAWSKAIEDSDRFFDERAVLRLLKLGEEQGAADYARALKNKAVDPELQDLIEKTLLPKTLLHASAIEAILRQRPGP
jgi:CBS domain-containing protein